MSLLKPSKVVVWVIVILDILLGWYVFNTLSGWFGPEPTPWAILLLLTSTLIFLILTIYLIVLLISFIIRKIREKPKK